MKVLWLVNSIFPYPASKLGLEKTCFGGWLNSMHEEIEKNAEIKIAVCTSYKGNEFLKFEDEKTCYYLIPDNNPALYKNHSFYWKKIVEDFKPDIVHIHGTEYPRGLSFINANLSIPTITSIQGLASSVADVYYGNIPVTDIIKNISFRDLIKLNTIFDCKRDFKKRAVYEKEMIKKSDYIIGRTLWDKTNILSIVPGKKYYHLNECLREPFYEGDKWDVKNIEKYSLFCSQSSYPIKGLHILLKSISILKNKYPNIKLYVSGMNIIDSSSFIKRIKRIGYGKYIKKLIDKYNIENNIEFVGYLDAKAVASRLLKTHIFISPSFIENESNSLSESAILGVPAIGSYVGGVTERIVHGETGFHYPSTEPAMLAHYIDTIFSDDKLASNIGNNARKKAIQVLDKNKNYQQLLKIYKEIIRK